MPQTPFLSRPGTESVDPEPTRRGAEPMENSAVEITNLLHRYAELMDAGDFEGCAALFADAAIILEPTSLKVCPIQSGALTFRLTIPGRATHAAMRWDGVSAIEKFNLIHRSILEFEKERHQSFDIKYYESKDRVAPINIGTIKGGEWHSTVPESVVAEGRLGVFPGELAQDARDAFETHLQTISETDDWLKDNIPTVEWFEGQFESGKTDINHPLIQSLSDCYHQTTGDAPIIEGVTYGSDLRLFTNHAHIPAVLFGPGDVRLAHAANEYVEIDEVMARKTLPNSSLGIIKK